MTVIVRLNVENDKPGRAVTVEVDAASAPHITLKVGCGTRESEWTWLSASEAIEVAEGLVAAARQLRTLKAVTA